MTARFKLTCAVLGVIGFVFAATPSATAQQNWPDKPITLVVPFAPGGTTDIVARLVAQPLGQKLGQNIVIDNVGGAGGTLGASNAARAAPDGYTLFLSTIAHTIAPGIYPKLSYDFQTDFDPITLVATVPNFLIVNPSVPATSVAELIAYIKANPGKVNYGSAGVGSVEHLAGELFKSTLKLDIAHVPYRGGALMLNDLVGGHIQMAIETSGAATPYIQDNRVRALAVSTMKRASQFPQLPTLAESGLPDYDVTTWYGLLTPKGVPQPIRARLYAAIADVLKMPDLQAKLRDFGGDPGGQSPQDFAAFIKRETEKWTATARQANIRAE